MQISPSNRHFALKPLAFPFEHSLVSSREGLPIAAYWPLIAACCRLLLSIAEYCCGETSQIEFYTNLRRYLLGFAGARPLAPYQRVPSVCSSS